MRSPAHFRQISSKPLRHTDARRGSVSRPVLSVVSATFKPGAFLENDVLPRHAHVGESHDGIVKRAQSHEPAAICDLQSRRIYIDDERRDLLAFFSADHLRRRARHDHQHAGFHAVSAPKFFAVQNELGAVCALAQRSGSVSPGRTCMDFRQCER